MSRQNLPETHETSGSYYPSTLSAPYYGSSIGTGAASQFNVRDLLMMLRRRRRLILCIVVIGTALAAIAGYNQPKHYTAETLLMIEPESKVVDIEAVVAGLSPDAAAVETQVKLLTSHDYLRQVTERLYGDDVLEIGEDAPVSWRQAIMGWLPRDMLIATGIAEEPTIVAPEIAREIARERKIGELKRNIGVEQQGRSYVIALRYTSPHPTEAARVANALGDLYIDDQIDRKLAGTQKATDFLEIRLAELEEEVQRTETAVETYRAEHGLLESKGIEVNTQQMTDLTNMLVGARAERNEKEARLRYIRSLQERGEGLQTLSEVLQSPLILQLMEQDAELQRQEAQLRTSYGERHPVMLNLQAEREKLAERIGIEIDNIVNNIENELQVLIERERSLAADMEKLVAQSDESSRAEIELRKLEREAQATRQIFENFLQRYKETKEQQEIVEADARIIARAQVPSAPSSIQPEVFAIIGFVASSMLGVLMALLRDRLDTAVRSGKEIEREFGLPCIGLVPFLKKGTLKGSRNLHGYLVDKPLSTYAETIRSIYTSLRLSNVDHPPKVIQVTSSVPSEGKTTLAVSLAASLAQNGLRTILVDLDMRHPSVKRELEVAQEGGLVDYMTGSLSLEQTIVHDEKSGIDVIGVKRTPPNPSRLLTSQRMRELIAVLREHYDAVILDSTPVLGVSDSKVTMEIADTVLFVVRWEKTTRDTAYDAIKELKDLGAELGGVVITQVDIDRHAQYGYGGMDAYYSKYKKYYVN